MAALAAGREAHVGVALLAEADVRDDASGRTPGGAVRHGGCPLVEKERGADAPFGQKRGQGRGPVAVHLLVLAEGQDDAPARALSAGEQVLYGLELGHEHVLDVQCPPAPDPLVVDHSREGATLPLPLGARDHGNHVLVGNEHGRLEGGVGSRQR